MNFNGIILPLIFHPEWPCHPELVSGSLLPGFYLSNEMPNQVLHDKTPFNNNRHNP